MNQIKIVNHITWILNAIREQNRLISQEIQIKMNDKVFMLNRQFQRFNQMYTQYLKLENNVEKGYRIIISTIPINKQGLISIQRIYLNRCGMYFKDTIQLLKFSRSELLIPDSIFQNLYKNFKILADLLTQLEKQLNYLIKII